MRRSAIGVFTVMAFWASAVWGQDVVSARAGLIHYVEGKVDVAGKLVDPTPSTKLFSQFPEVKEGQLLKTEAGRAEVLLSPGVILRVGEDSSVKMISNRLIDTRVELVSGSAVLDVADLLKENTVTVIVNHAHVQPKRTGIYKLAAEPANLMVYEGQAEVLANDQTKIFKKGSSVTLDDQLVATKFDPEKGDSLLRWSIRRSGYLAMANVSAAKSLLDSGRTWSSSNWMWNPYYGMFTFIPARGSICSSFMGYCYYSPQRIYSVYYRPAYRPSYGGGAMSGGGSPRYGYSSTMGQTVASQRSAGGYSSGASVSAGAPMGGGAPAMSSGGGVRGTETSAGRGGGGGGRGR